MLHHIGLTVREDPQQLFQDLDTSFPPLWRNTRAYTMTSTERMYALYKATEYISTNHIQGDIVECGVWRGGSTMLCAYELTRLHDEKRTLYLYDTYSGMAEPDQRDKTISGNMPAHDIWNTSQKDGTNAWCYASLSEVKKNLYQTHYPIKCLKFIKGKVEETIPKYIPRHIALLRLDTDWFASTYHELTYLYPRLVSGGVLLLDDYGHWKGAKEAVDTYFHEHNIHIMLTRIDYTGRIAIKT